MTEVGTRQQAADISHLEAEQSAHIAQAQNQNYIVGVILLLVVVVLWTASNFLTEDLFQGGYEKPFLVTYANTSSFSLYLIPFLYRYWRHGSRKPSNTSSAHYVSLNSDPEHSHSPPPHTIVAEPELSPRLTTRETAELAASFCVLWFVANWSVNASLDYTSVASCTILASMSGFFTFALGRLFKVEAFSKTKLAAVLLSFGGVLLVSLSDSTSRPSLANKYPSTPNPNITHPSLSPLPSPTAITSSLIFPRSTTITEPGLTSNSSPLLGDTLALVSALFYAFYVVLLKVRIRSESRIDMKLFFGFVGVFNIIALWPAGVVLHFTGVERFEVPVGRKEWTVVLINMFITFSSDILYVLAMLKTTPLLATIGISLTIPLAILGDFFLGIKSRPQALLGAALGFGGFIIVGFEDREVAQQGNVVGQVLFEDEQPILGRRSGEEEDRAEVLGNEARERTQTTTENRAT